jgi:hypothetical protein
MKKRLGGKHFIPPSTDLHNHGRCSYVDVDVSVGVGVLVLGR